MFGLLLMFAVLLSGLIVRLLWLQVMGESVHVTGESADMTVSGRESLTRSVSQRERTVTMDTGRGHFYDRNGIPLTGEPNYGLAFFPFAATAAADSANEIASILGVPAERWRAFTENSREPAFWKRNEVDATPAILDKEQLRQISQLNITGLDVLSWMKRYKEPYLAAHLIGHLAENTQTGRQEGAAGLERSFERWLKGAGPTQAVYVTDGNGNPLQGLGLRLKTPAYAYYPLHIMTTLDINLQQRIEQLVDRFGVRAGAVVVLDAETADVTAMISRPQMNPYQVDPKSTYWNNRAIKAAIPGSVFKTVVAAAAINEGVVKPSETFVCKEHLGKYGFSCWKKGGHGTITFAEAYAQSCNIAFARVVERLSPEVLERYARALGLAHPIGWNEAAGNSVLRQFDGEDKGQIFAAGADRSDAGALVQTSIGQRDVRMSPLQGAAMVVSLLHKGRTIQPRIVSGIRYNNGSTAVEFPLQFDKESGVLTERTSRLMRTMMQEVVRHGTGQQLKGGAWTAAGKSGTAQTVTTIENHWFIGYTPVERPKYAIAVLTESAPNASKNMATNLFSEIVSILRVNSK